MTGRSLERSSDVTSSAAVSSGRPPEPEQSRVVIIGGTEWVMGGVEIFVRRMVSLWPSESVTLAGVRAANSALSKVEGRKFAAGLRTVGALLGNVKFVRKEVRRGSPVTVWYQYGNGIDLLHIALLSLLGRARIVVTAHCANQWAHLRGRSVAGIVCGILNRVDCLLVLSHGQKELFERLGVTTVRRADTILDEAYTAAEPALRWHERAAGSIVFAGRVCREKGILDALAVVDKLADAEPNTHWTFRIYGSIDADVRSRVMEATKHRKSNMEVCLLGYADAKTLADQFRQSRYVLYLSRMDAYPLTVLECLACGALPIVYCLAGTSEIIRRWGGLEFDAGDLRAIVDGILETEQGDSEPSIVSQDVRRTFSFERAREGIVELFGDTHCETVAR